MKLLSFCFLSAAVLLLQLFPAARAAFGIDFIDPASVSQMQCLLNNGMFYSTRVYHDGEGGGCDGIGGQNIEAGYAAGYNAGGGVLPYIFPNAPTMVSGANTPEGEVQAALWCTTAAGFPHGGIYWLDIEQDPYNPWPDCATSSSYILRMIAELYNYGPIVGIYTSVYEWQAVTCQTEDTALGRSHIANFTSRLYEIARETQPAREANMKKHGPAQDVISMRIATNETFRSLHATPIGDSNLTVLLWYAHYDNNPSFSDFTPFGPFKSAFAKQYSDNCNTCGLSSDCDWSPIS